MKRAKLSPEEYLRLPYTRKIIPDEESGTYSAEIDEFPGCIAQGDTAKEAYEKLEEVAKSWIGAALDLGQEIPPPSTVQDYSGKFALRLPKSIHRQASLVADKEGTSLNQFIVFTLSEKLGATNLYEKLTQRILEINQEFIFKTTLQSTPQKLIRRKKRRLKSNQKLYAKKEQPLGTGDVIT